MKCFLSWRSKKPMQVELNAKCLLFPDSVNDASGCLKEAPLHTFHRIWKPFVNDHNLGLRPYEKKTFIHLQNSIMRSHKCKDKTCYHLSWIKLSGVRLPWEKSKSRTIIDFSHTTFTMKHLTNTSFRLLKRLERKLSIQWQSKPVRG